MLACTTVTILASYRNLETAEYKKAISRIGQGALGIIGKAKNMK